MAKKLKVAVTGGIGSGKSTVCDLFREEGYPVIVADDVAKRILADDENVRRKIIDEFGDETYINGKLNKVYLAERVFNNTASVEKINSIVHPPTIIKINQLVQEQMKNINIVFVESALIFEAKMTKDYSYTILITSDDAYKIKRVVERDKVSSNDVIKRLEKQMPDDLKKSRVDFVIENNSTLDDLKTRASFILSILKNLT